MGRLAPIGFKPVSRSVAADGSALLWIKWNPLALLNAAGATVTAATVESQANLIDLQVNGGAETVIGTYTGNSGADNQVVYGDTNAATVQQVLNVLNGVAPGQTSAVTRWRAGLGDFRPQFVLGTGDGLAVAAANAMLGRGHQGLSVPADSSGLASANTISVGLGEPRAKEGLGPSIPDHFESDYTSTTAGVQTSVRAAARRSEEQPGRSTYQVFLTDLQVGALFATTKIATVYDNAGNTLKVWNLGAATAIPNSGLYTVDSPAVVGPPGSPLWVEVTGTGSFTDGTVTASGFIRIN